MIQWLCVPNWCLIWNKNLPSEVYFWLTASNPIWPRIIQFKFFFWCSSLNCMILGQWVNLSPSSTEKLVLNIIFCLKKLRNPGFYIDIWPKVPVYYFTEVFLFGVSIVEFRKGVIYPVEERNKFFWRRGRILIDRSKK